jgi:hypothetical protein
LCSAKRAPTRSECLRNLSEQLATQVACDEARSQGARLTKGKHQLCASKMPNRERREGARRATEA